HEQPGDPWWDPIHFGRDLTQAPPASVVGGWYDLFLPWQVDDYLALRAAGRQARLTIGPWTHTSPGGLLDQLRDGLEWFDEHLLKERPAIPRREVRLWVLGAGRWVELDSWPPPATPQRWHLQAGGGLAPAAPAEGPPDRYRYDPADPTPAIGGPSLNWRTSGPRDQAGLEDRPDVLTYTSVPLERDMTVAGPLRARIWLRASRAHTDLFVRLCDVDSGGTSRNLSDGILRLGPGDPAAAPDGSRGVDVSMWPTAATFRAGHRIRLQVSSGAHPLFVRNLGSGERLGSGTTLLASDQEVFHDPAHPSAIDLPVSPI
ncbi:MAG: CocE/NonD family hydrolase, partial [Acidimicrobiales bacterium]